MRKKDYYIRYLQEFTPTEWWKIVNKKATRQGFVDLEDFSQFMVNLHSCPSSSAGIERWFSTIGFIWSKTRNRLGAEKAKKLATCYRALREKQVAKVVTQDQDDVPDD